MYLQLKHINQSFGKEQVIRNLSFGLEQNKTQSILGASGCGKTTLLKIIAGLLNADGGEILLKEKNISLLPPNQRNIVYLNQEPLLFPHLDVFENIAFGLRLRKVNKRAIHERTKLLLSRLELEGQSKKLPEQLSGGQKQRVAFGRAIIINPPVLLLDEPFASLDAEVRTSMQQLMKQVAKEFNITAVFVTHDLKEAILMADHIAIMRNGTLKCFESVHSFIQSAETGVQNEIDFWKSL